MLTVLIHQSRKDLKIGPAQIALLLGERANRFPRLVPVLQSFPQLSHGVASDYQVKTLKNRQKVI